MKTPKGQEEFPFAELFIQLPGDWQYTSPDPNWSWPIHSLRKIAQYPHNNDTWLGGPVASVANDDPPQPLAPNTNMTSLLLIAEHSFDRQADKTVQLYRLAADLYRRAPARDSQKAPPPCCAPSIKRAFRLSWI